MHSAVGHAFRHVLQRMGKGKHNSWRDKKPFTSGGRQGGRTVLDREHLANAQARIVVDLCKLLHSLGCYFTIENPHDRVLLHSAVFCQLCESISVSCCLIEFDQCALDYSYRRRIATLSIANALTFTPMTFPSTVVTKLSGDFEKASP